MTLRSLGRAAALVLPLLGAALPALPPVSPAEAAPAARRPLSAQDKFDIERAEAYLNSISTLKARFLQLSSNGGQAEGTAYLSRPGKLRLQYDPPSPLLVVADGSRLIIHDKQLGEPSYIPLDATPAGILVRANVHLDGKDVTVTRVARQPGAVTITMVESDDPGSGELSLVFADRPFELRQWRVVDPQGQTTTVSLFDAQTGLALDSKLFEFRDPKFDKPRLNLGGG